MPTFDLALGLRMIRRAADMLHVLVPEPRRQITCNIGCAIVAEQSRPLRDGDIIEARRRKRLIERCRDVGGAHRGTEPPGHDVTREVVEHGGQIIPAPAGDLQVGKVSLPELIDGGVLYLNSFAALITT